MREVRSKKRRKKNFLDVMEKKYGRFAIENISLYLIIGYAIGYTVQLIAPELILHLTLNAERICHGEVWRLVSWILIPPPNGNNLFFMLILLYFYYSIGSVLERVWGKFRYNLYLFSGMLFTVIGAFILYVYILSQAALTGAAMIPQEYFRYSSLAFSTYYINMSIFLAYATTFPEHKIFLMMIIPIKIKYLGIIYAALIFFDVIGAGLAGKIVIIASILNFIVFFIIYRNKGRVSWSHRKKQAEFKREVKVSTVVIRHKCSICGKTDKDSPELEFRYCSKCKGEHEYCQEHLFTHKHIE